jgi:hypothetical protein
VLNGFGDFLLFYCPIIKIFWQAFFLDRFYPIININDFTATHITMPSILSRLLGRKKSQDPESPSDKPGRPTALLEGKFEAVSPTVSPSAAYFADPGAAHIRGAKDKESPFHLLRARSRPSDLSTVEKAVPDVPHLSLNLPLTKERGRALDVVFESEHNAFALLNEATIREKRLAPREALSLVRACSQVIQERGALPSHF